MCNPVALAWVGVAIAAGGTAYQIDAGNKATSAAEAQNEENKKAANVQAKSVIDAGSIAEEQQRQRTRQMLAAQRTTLAANNVDMNTGTPMDILGDTAGMGEQDALSIRANAARQAWGIQAGQTNANNQTSLNSAANRNNATGSYLTLASNTLGGIGKNPSMYGIH